MKRKLLCGLLGSAMLLLLWGCSKSPANIPESIPEEASLASEVTEPVIVPTVPADGNPEDVTCKGSYTGSGSRQDIVATVGNVSLTNEALAVWYWAAVAQYRETGSSDGPDFDQPLDTQVCPIDSGVRSWQQYFLKQALEAWHTSQALTARALTEPLTYEAAYQPNAKNHANNMLGRPATEFLYGYDTYYEHNTMHQAYLDAIPETLEQLAADAGLAGTAELAETAFGTTLSALTHSLQSYNEDYT